MMWTEGKRQGCMGCEIFTSVQKYGVRFLEHCIAGFHAAATANPRRAGRGWVIDGVLSVIWILAVGVGEGRNEG